MAEFLQPETEERIRALCQKISVSFDLDPEIQEELYGHLEDKLHAYLNGEEVLTEEDAFILVQEHFGNPAILKALFQNVHVYGYHVGFARRLLAALTASCGVLILQSVLFCLMTIGMIQWADIFGISDTFRVFMAVTMAVIQVGCILLMGCILYRWQRRIEQGARLWFIRWPVPALAGIVLLLACVQRAIPHAHTGSLLNTPTYTSGVLLAYLFFVVCVETSLVLGCLCWMWWCDRPPRTARTLTYTLAAWLSVQLLGFLIPPVQLSVRITALGLPFTDLFTYVNIAQGPLADNYFTWYLRWEVPGVFRIYACAQILVMCAFAGYLSRLLYRLIPRFHAMPIKSPQ